MTTTHIDVDKVYAEAKRISTERGHAPDLTDLDMIVDDVIDKPSLTTDDALRRLDELISWVTCILTGAEGENADDCTTHEHETRTPEPKDPRKITEGQAKDLLNAVRMSSNSVALTGIQRTVQAWVDKACAQVVEFPAAVEGQTHWAVPGVGTFPASMTLTYEAINGNHGIFDGSLLVAVVGECIQPHARAEAAKGYAERIVKSVNNHNSLVAALRNLLSDCDTCWDDGDNGRIDCTRKGHTQARAALAAEGD